MLHKGSSLPTKQAPSVSQLSTQKNVPLSVRRQRDGQQARSSVVFATPSEVPAESKPSPLLLKKPLIDMSSKQGASRRHVLVGSMVAAGLAACPCCSLPAQASEWNYENRGADWGGTCATGMEQSPVNLPLTSVVRDQPKKTISKFGDIVFSYRPQERVEIFNTGHGTMQVNFEPGNMAMVAGKEMELLQYHFHNPSEHSIDGRRTPMEVHLVHRVVDTGGLAVVGILLEEGGVFNNQAVQTALSSAPLKLGKLREACSLVDPVELLPKKDANGHRPYLHYKGSLTTPPCTEGVDWFVMTNTVKIADKQIVEFMKYVGGGTTYAQNSRLIQPINEREIGYEVFNKLGR